MHNCTLRASRERFQRFAMCVSINSARLQSRPTLASGWRRMCIDTRKRRHATKRRIGRSAFPAYSGQIQLLKLRGFMDFPVQKTDDRSAFDESAMTREADMR